MAMNEAPTTAVTFVESSTHPPLRLLERRWPRPSCAPVAGVLLLHGGGWHSGWFGELGEALRGRGGCVVHAIDLLSQGGSDAIAGQRGFFRSFGDFVGDARAALARLGAAAPGAPLFVLGESVGGITATLLALQAGGGADDEGGGGGSGGARVAGLVLAGAALRVRDALLPPWPVGPLVRALARVFPHARVPGEAMSGETWDEAFGDPGARKLSKEDPLVAYRAPVPLASLAALLAEMDGIVQKAKTLRVDSLLAMHYVDDSRVSFQAVKEAVDGAAHVRTRKIVPLEGNAHQIFQDVPEVRGPAIETIVQFVREQCAS